MEKPAAIVIGWRLVARGAASWPAGSAGANAQIMIFMI
jgi:hypothetical protein